MSDLYRLKVWLPNKSRVKAVYTSSLNGGLIDGFQASVLGSGVCKSMTFDCKPIETNIASNDIVELELSNRGQLEQVFYGVIVSSHDPRSPDRASMEALGAKYLLRKSVLVYEPVSTIIWPADIGFTARVVLSQYARLHPGLKYTSSLIDSSKEIAEFDAPLITVYQALEALANGDDEIGEDDWGADEYGRIVFRPRQGSAFLFVGDVFYKHGNIAGEDVCTKANIRVLDSPIPALAKSSPNSQMRLLAHTYESPQHTDVRYEESFNLPDGSFPFYENIPIDFTNNSNTSNWDNLVNAFDNSANTYATNATGDGNVLLSLEVVEGTHGIIIDHELKTYAELFVVKYEIFTYNPGGDVEKFKAYWSFPGQTTDADEPERIRILWPELYVPEDNEVLFRRIFVRILLPNSSQGGEIRLNRIRTLELDRSALNQAAKRKIVLPSYEVTEVTCNSLVNGPFIQKPVAKLRVGKDKNVKDVEDIEGNVAEVTYVASVDDGLPYSVISLGQKSRTPAQAMADVIVQKALRGGKTI